MLTHTTKCSARTESPPAFVDLTDHIREAVASSPVGEGRVTVFAPGGGCAILINERESGLLEDLKGTIARLRDGDESGAHVVVGAPSVVLPVSGGALALGTWQRVLLVELDEPGERTVSIQVVGEA